MKKVSYLLLGIGIISILLMIGSAFMCMTFNIYLDSWNLATQFYFYTLLPLGVIPTLVGMLLYFINKKGEENESE